MTELRWEGCSYKPRSTKDCRQWPEARTSKGGLFPGAEGTRPYQHLHFGLLTFKTQRENWFKSLSLWSFASSCRKRIHLYLGKAGWRQVEGKAELRLGGRGAA